MKVMKIVDQRRAGDGEECRINQRLLHAIAQIFRLHQVLHQRASKYPASAPLASPAATDSHRSPGRCAGNRATPARSCGHPPAPGAARASSVALAVASAASARIESPSSSVIPACSKCAELLGEDEQLACAESSDFASAAPRARRRSRRSPPAGPPPTASIRIGM